MKLLINRAGDLVNMNKKLKFFENQVQPAVLNTAQTSIFLGLSQSTLSQLRMSGSSKNRVPPIPYVRLGKKIGYLRNDLESWLQKHRVDSK